MLVQAASVDPDGVARLLETGTISQRASFKEAVKRKLRATGPLRDKRLAMLMHLETLSIPDDARMPAALLPAVVDPGLTLGHTFRIRCGDWIVQARDGQALAVSQGSSETGDTAAVVDASFSYVSGALIPAMLLRRWIDAARGEVLPFSEDRAERLRVIQASRIDVTDPLHELIARGERERWSPAEIDLAEDRVQWVLLPSGVQAELREQLAPVAAATERMAAGIAALMPAAPNGETEHLLIAQAAELARHVRMLDRVAAEVMALEGSDLRERMRELRADDGDARALARRIATIPHGLDPFIDGVAAWHIGCGRAASGARRILCERLTRYELLPGVVKAMELMERDGLRYLEFAGYVLDESFARRPDERETVEIRLKELAVSS
jgi:hypothetical protein